MPKISLLRDFSMTHSDQLATVGERVLKTIVETYNPAGDPSKALALHPGQALADDIVQNGVTNALRLSEWIEDQYDYPLLLRRSDMSSLSTSSVGSVSAKSAYLAMIPWAQPSVPPQDPAYPRIADLISEARQNLGDNPGALPFSCEPTDFAEPDSSAWHVFSQTITESSSEETKQPLTGVTIDRKLWKLRAVTPQMVEALPSTLENSTRHKAVAATIWAKTQAGKQQDLGTLLRRKPETSRLSEILRQPATASAPSVRVSGVKPKSLASKGLSTRGALGQMRRSPGPSTSAMLGPRSAVVAQRAVMPQRHAPKVSRLNKVSLQKALDQKTIDRLTNVQITDLVARPAVEHLTVKSSNLHVHFEYCLVTITRKLAGRSWWSQTLIQEENWSVPGMKKGDFVQPPTDQDFAYCLPQALLLVRNVKIRGSWVGEAKTVLQNNISFLGPFLMKPATSEARLNESSIEEIEILGVGIQVIGEICSLLPALPPRDGS